MAIVLLDDFNRSNGAPGSNWAIPVVGYNLPNITSNALDWTNQFPGALWVGSSFAANQGGQVQAIGGAEFVSILLRWTNPNTGAENGYEVDMQWGGLGPAEAWLVTSGIASRTSLGFANGIMLSTDKWVRATISGNTITAYGSSDGSSWNQRQTWSDSTITGGGNVGVFVSNNVWPGTLDNFGAGNLDAEKQAFYVSRRRTVQR